MNSLGIWKKSFYFSVILKEAKEVHHGTLQLCSKISYVFSCSHFLYILTGKIQPFLLIFYYYYINMFLKSKSVSLFLQGLNLSRTE